MNPRYLVAVLTVSGAGLAGIMLHEGSVPRVYLDPVGIPTACVGHTGTVTRADIGLPMSRAVCEYLLSQDVQEAEAAVRRCTTAKVTQEQYDSLVSFTFNVGAANYCGSTLLRKANAGDCLGAANEFNRWVYARGQRLPGLVTRRSHEADAFRSGC